MKLIWQKNLYVGESLVGKEKKYKSKINRGCGVIDIYLLTLPHNEENQLEIISANQLLQKVLRRRCPRIIGMTRGYDEALDMLVMLASKVYADTGALDIKSYLNRQEVNTHKILKSTGE
ncbi:MAG: hypothetical protein PHC41_01935 [Lachnospiraceae bacterium]|nr:hypothetical protein [Lachnospiraceae bacterium]MDD3614970.1 hypothetical protein [Lachnospiraceae bacterium]